MAKGAWWLTLTADLQDNHAEWSTSTVNRVLSAGSTVLTTVVRAGLVDMPIPNITRLREGEHRQTWFTKEEVTRLSYTSVDVFDRLDLADAITFSAYTGVRQGELMLLKVEDIDYGLNCIWVGGRKGRETKGKNVRSIPIHDSIEALIQRRTKDRPGNALLFGSDWANKDQLYRAFRKVRDHLGFSEDYVWHSLRHSFGTWVGEVAHPRQIMALMGHKQVETSLRYCKATDNALKAAIHSL